MTRRYQYIDGYANIDYMSCISCREDKEDKTVEELIGGDVYDARTAVCRSGSCRWDENVRHLWPDITSI